MKSITTVNPNAEWIQKTHWTLDSSLPYSGALTTTQRTLRAPAVEFTIRAFELSITRSSLFLAAPVVGGMFIEPNYARRPGRPWIEWERSERSLQIWAGRAYLSWGR